MKSALRSWNVFTVTLASGAAALVLASTLVATDADAQTSATDAGTADAGTTAVADAGATPTATTSDAGAPRTDAGATSILDKPVGSDGATYAVRLRDLESRVDELKDQIRRSHTKLSLLSDTILSGGVAGARANITFKNEMSSAYKLTKALFVLDGAVQYNRQDESGALAGQKEIPIFTGNVAAGDHTISVVLKFRGSSLAVFQYAKGYEFEQKSSHSFTTGEGKSVQITAVAYERGNATTPYEDRPAVSWQEKVGAMSGKPAAPAAGGGVSVQVGGGK